MVLDSVVDQIDDHLDDEPGVHIRHQQIVLQFYRDMVLLRIAVQMGQGFMKDLDPEAPGGCSEKQSRCPSG